MGSPSGLCRDQGLEDGQGRGSVGNIWGTDLASSPVCRLGDFTKRIPGLLIFPLFISLISFVFCFSLPLRFAWWFESFTMFRPVLRQATRSGAAPRPTAARAFASASGPTFNWQDPLASKNLFTEEEVAIAETAERYCQERMLPRVLRMYTFLHFFCPRHIRHSRQQRHTDM